MEENLFSTMELDAIGEIMNISLGSSATAVSNMLDHRVDITTPLVSVVAVEEFSIGDLEPAIGVEIKYVSGLEGRNIMLLKRNDVKVIVDILMGTESADEEFELNDLSVSAVCEVMNQMMGAASTALSDFLGRSVNISTPYSFTMDNFEQFKKEYFEQNTKNLVAVRFTLAIEDALESEFVYVMSLELARELLEGFGMDGNEHAQAPQPTPEPSPAGVAAASGESAGGKMSQEEIERLMGGGGASPAASGAGGSPGGKMSQEEIERLMGGAGGGAAPAAAPTPVPPPGYPDPMAAPPPGYPPQPGVPMYPPQPGMPMYPPQPGVPMYAAPSYPMTQPKVIQTSPVQLPALDVSAQLGEEQAQNLELIMSVPLEVSVEIGRTRRRVEEILTFSKGSLVVLDKLAGDQVDIFVNGMCVAHGDVVVIDDNFGVRITEVMKQPGLAELTSKK